MHSITGGFLLDCIVNTIYSSDIDLLIINKKNVWLRRRVSIDVMRELYNLGYATQNTVSNCFIYDIFVHKTNHDQVEYDKLLKEYYETINGS
jgi:predicted nucleotidyltransferase